MKQFMLASIAALSVLVSSGAAVAAVSQSYDVLDNTAKPGMIMSLTTAPNVAEPANETNVSFLMGVYVSGADAFDKQPGQISVQTDSQAEALVSTLNGNVKVGDRITASSITGIGARAQKSTWIVGIAQASLDAKTPGAITSSVTDSRGDKRTIYVARVPLIINATYFNAPAKSSPFITEPTLFGDVQKAANNVAGKKVSTLTLMLVFLLIVAGVILASNIMTTAIRSGFAAVSRQPLVKKMIYRKVFQSFLFALVILAAAVFGAGLILRLL